MAGNSDPVEPRDIVEVMQHAAKHYWHFIQTNIFETFSVQDLENLELVSTEKLQEWLEQQQRVERPYGPGKPTTRDLFTYALVLCEVSDWIPDLDLNARLEKLFALARAVQLTRSGRFPHKPGNFYWWIEGRMQAILKTRGVISRHSPGPHIDQNGADFCMQGAALLWLRHRHRMSRDVRALLRRIMSNSSVTFKQQFCRNPAVFGKGEIF